MTDKESKNKEVKEQVIELGNEKITVFGGTLTINAEMTEFGICELSGTEVKVRTKIVDNVETQICEVDGKQYKTCEEGCPIWNKQK